MERLSEIMHPNHFPWTMLNRTYDLHQTILSHVHIPQSKSPKSYKIIAPSFTAPWGMFLQLILTILISVKFNLAPLSWLNYIYSRISLVQFNSIQSNSAQTNIALIRTLFEFLNYIFTSTINTPKKRLDNKNRTSRVKKSSLVLKEKLNFTLEVFNGAGGPTPLTA